MDRRYSHRALNCIRDLRVNHLGSRSNADDSIGSWGDSIHRAGRRERDGAGGRGLKMIAGFIAIFKDILRGLFPLSTADAPEGCDYAKVVEERYSKPRRCC